MLDPTFGYEITVGFALLFALSAGHKFRHLNEFTEVLVAHRILPELLARRGAFLIPVAEAAVSASLLADPVRRIGVLGAIFLLLLYAGSIALNLVRGRRDLDCGCGAIGRRRAIAGWMLWRNLCLALVLSLSATPWSIRSMTVTDAVTIIGLSIVAAILYVALDALLGDIVPKTRSMRNPT